MSKVIVSLSFILLFIFFTAMGTIDGAIPQIERDALIALYNSTNGDEWEDNSGWKTGNDFAPWGTENGWHGITCDQENTVTGINLENNNLAGTIPSQLGNLLNLESLYLNSNQLTGTIPPELGNLSKLIILYLDSNQLTGAIPPELGKLSKLYILYLDTNQLTGTIPKELGDIQWLTELSIYYNQLTGAIPPELKKLSNLTTLYLDSNQLGGTIPQELGNLSNLEYLYLASNQLEGIIPQEFGSLSNLEYLYLDSNRLTGVIPWQLGNLSKLTDLSLYSNQLTGSIPPELGNLSNLTTLYLDSNRLEGVIPRELGDLLKLKYLYLNSNKLTGKIPDEIENLTNLEYSESDFRWNGLYTNNETLRNFLNKAQIDKNWESTQTVAPEGVIAQYIDKNSIEVSWQPITYTSDEGGYKVSYSLTPGGPYTLFAEVNNKEDYRIKVTKSKLASEYYFVVNSWTNPHKKNQSKIQSENSAEVSSNIAIKVVIISGKVEKRRKEGVNGVILTFNPPNKFTNTDNNGNYRHIVDSPWTGTLVPKKPGYEFKPKERELTNVTSNQPGINFDAIPIYKEISGKVSAARGGIDGVTLTFTSNNITETVNTNDKGEYSHKVPFGWSGRVTPTKNNLSFSPAYKDFVGVNEDKKNENYELSISFTLTAIWKKDKALIMYKDYGEIESKIPEIEFSTKAIKEYILYRKEKEETGTFVAIVRFPAQEQKNFSYKDEDLVNGKEYIYVAEEIDEQGKIIGQSDEVQLNWVSK